MSPKIISAGWEILVSDANSHSLSKVKAVSPEAHAMIADETAKFTQQPSPVDEAELKVRYLQSKSLVSVKIDGISYGDQQAKKHPAASVEIFEQVARLCDSPFPTSVTELHDQYELSGVVTKAITDICYNAET